MNFGDNHSKLAFKILLILRRNRENDKMSNLVSQNSADVFVDFNCLPDELLDASADAPTSVGGGGSMGMGDSNGSAMFCGPNTSFDTPSVSSAPSQQPPFVNMVNGGGSMPPRNQQQHSGSGGAVPSPHGGAGFNSPVQHSMHMQQTSSLGNQGQGMFSTNQVGPGGMGPGGGGGMPQRNNSGVLEKLLLNPRMPSQPGNQQQSGQVNMNAQHINPAVVAVRQQNSMVQQTQQQQQMVFSSMRSPVGGMGSPRGGMQMGYGPAPPNAQMGGQQGPPPGTMNMMPPQYQQRAHMMAQGPMQGMMPGGPRQAMMNGPTPQQMGIGGGQQNQSQPGAPPPGVRMTRTAGPGGSATVVHMQPAPGGGGMPPNAMMGQNGPMMMTRMHMGPRYQDATHFGGHMPQQQGGGPGQMRMIGNAGQQQVVPHEMQPQTAPPPGMMQSFPQSMNNARMLPPYTTGGPMNNMPNNMVAGPPFSNGPTPSSMMPSQASGPQQQQQQQVGPPGMLASPGMMQQQVQQSSGSNQLTGTGNQQPATSNSQQGGGVGGNAQALLQDPEKRKLIQQQLVLLLHAHKCQQRDNTDGCNLPHCQTMKGVLNHMQNCNDGRSCTVPHCASSRQIIAHWKSCTRVDCPVCLPLKQMSDKRPGSVGGASGAMAQLGDVMVADFGRLTSNSGGGGSNSGIGSLMSNGNRADDARQMLCLDERGYPLSNSGDNLSSSMSQHALPPPEAIGVSKQWHEQVTQDLRNHLVSKLVKAIFPSPDPAAMQDHRIKDLISYARKVEREMFEQANDREEYYHLLAEKIYKIQKELQEKKAKRLEQQKTTTGGGGGSLCSNSDQSCSSNSVANVHAVFKSIDATVPPNKTIQMDHNNGSSIMPPAMGRSGPMGGHQGPPQPGSQMLGSMMGNQQMSNRAAMTSPNLNIIASEDYSKPIIKSEPSFGKMIKSESSSSTDDKPNFKSSGGPPTQADNDTGIDGTKPSTSSQAQQSLVETKPQTIGNHGPPTCKKVFSVDELCQALLPVWEKLQSAEESLPFQDPVDPITLQIPDYCDVVKNPMDLSTIRKKLLNGMYKDHWEFCNDMWLMFDNAWLYNRKNSRVYKYCTRLSEIFTEEIDPVMRQAGYCCGRKLAFTPLALVCYGQTMCAIPRDAYYYGYETKPQFGVASERYTYCKKCFEELPGDSINLSDEASSNNLVYKTQFQLLKNDHIEHEPFVNCVDCGRQWHQICALHFEQIWPSGFICDSCLRTKTKKRLENRFTAKRLPHCKLSQHLENRVNSYLRKKDGCHSVDVIIRVLASSDKEVEVKPYVKSKFCSSGEMSQKFPYRAKAIFAFEVIDGTEVCFFGLHVQEYGDKAAPPNSRRVYIAYLDSVHFFQPKHQRTNVYHELLLGYLEYSKSLGYTMAHIWACPPSEGDDYIFHCHPVEQKIPKPKRLQDWYKKMLDRGIVERLVVDYKDIHKQALDDNLQSPAELPYFEGDYWPNVLEDCIKEFEKEEAERRRELEMQQAQANDSNGDEGDDDIEEFPNIGGKRKNIKGSQKKHKNKMKSGQYKKSKKSGGTGASGNQLTDKILAAMEKHKEVFFVVRLHSVHSAASLGSVNDPDQLISCELMDGRDNFLSTARERHWEFSSLRRAKWSTLALCYELHTQGQDKFTYTCNSCKNNNALWHCTTCEDFDLCQQCYSQTTHPHKMEQQKSLLQDDSGSGGEQASQNSRTESIQRCVQSLVHSCQCRDANCRRMTCHKMKRVVMHTRQCKRRQTGPCTVCKQLIALCCYHAKHCQEQQCPVPFCPNIRQKLAEQAAQLKKKRDREMIRRIQLMGGGGGPGPSGAGGPASPSSGGQQETPPVAPVQFHHQQPQPSVHPSSMPPPNAMVVTHQMPPQNAVLAAKQVERIAQQTAATGGRYMTPMGVGGPTPNMMGPRGGGPRMMVPPQTGASFGWDGGGGPQGQFIRQPQQMRGGAGGPPPNVAVGPSPMMVSVQQGAQQQKMLNARLSEVLQALRAANPDDAKEIMTMLQKDPPLLQAFMRLRSSNNPQQQQQQPPPNQAMMQQQQQWPPPPGTMVMGGPQQQQQGQRMYRTQGPISMPPNARFVVDPSTGNMRPMGQQANMVVVQQQQQQLNRQPMTPQSPYGGPAVTTAAFRQQAMSPQQQGAAYFQQHRSPPGVGNAAAAPSPMAVATAGRSPATTAAQSPHVGQQQSTLQHLLEGGAGDGPGSQDQNKFM